VPVLPLGRSGGRLPRRCGRATVDGPRHRHHQPANERRTNRSHEHQGTPTLAPSLPPTQLPTPVPTPVPTPNSHPANMHPRARGAGLAPTPTPTAQ
jgi:hypothetical protein